MENKIDFKRIILTTVATAGILAIAVLAPNTLQVLKPFLKKKKKYNLKYYLSQKTKKLIKDGFLKINIENGKQFLSLTKKGERRLLYYKITDKKENSKWDGKWRVVIFDVWENTRHKRNLLRNEIKDFGFIQLQRSVWIYPYECADFIELLKTNLSFGKNIRYMVVEKLDYDEKLRKYFGLK
jgi:DNA-binding transcriptional regulator PaaX